MLYETATPSFSRFPSVLAYYSGVLYAGSGADNTRVWTVSLTEPLSMARAMFVNTKAGACSMYYTGTLRFDHVTGALLFRRSVKIWTPWCILAYINSSYRW